ncbi:hypothetical protein [Psychrobacillus soli]|uniref:Uncharacterized protein n=1 Tax=Psychrobacillus soli TaxID=1543965 RepID=A0A544TJ17_9BACI|nr:hypothetical protein [Psychrobacillus soli]TQR17451.1 hypothetical protein FG383_05185 [Psychrobacillus soli]
MQSMIDNFLALEPKDKFTSLGVIFTAIIGLVTLFFSVLNNQRNVYASTILKERLDSLNNLKKNSASFIALILASTKGNSLEHSYKEIKYLSNLIEYQFNVSKGEEVIVLNKIKYLLRLIRLRIEERDIVQIGDFIQKYDMEFFRGLNLAHYNVQTLRKLMDKIIYESTEEIEVLLKNHIKSEWEKIKYKQRSLRFK